MTFNGNSVSNVSIALLHYPVYNKHREVVATAVTNLDIHDIARSAKTYGLARYYLVTPVVEQQKMAERIRNHWLEGWGAGYNPQRKEALELLQIVASLGAVLTDLEERHGRPAKLVTTGAQVRSDSTSFKAMRGLLADAAQPYLLLFGTGWGLTEEVFSQADFQLESIQGVGAYNHLSVRSAAAIILDRLVGER